MADKNEEKAYPFIIPANFYNQFHLMGQPFEYKFVLQTVVIVAVISVVLWTLLNKVMSWVYALSIILTIDALIALLSLNGIQGDTFIAYISKVLRYNSHKRIAYYNPRIKVEAESDLMADRETQPKDKLTMMLENYKKSLDKKHQQAAEEILAEKDTQDELYFQDDIGVVDKPYEYMTRKERWEYDRKKKKELKEGKNG